MTQCDDSHMNFSELTAIHSSIDMTNKKDRRDLYAAMVTADRASLEAFTSYLTERGALGAA